MSEGSGGRDLALGVAQAARGGALAKFGIIAVVLVLGGVIVLGAISGGGGQGTTTASGGDTDPCSGVLPQAGAGTDLDPSQEEIARAADEVATDMSMPGQAVLLILMTGLQESGLRNIDYGDRDSIGWLQQRPSQGWGTVEQIMDPAYGARQFYETLRRVPGWVDMPYWQAADAVQRSAFPEYYSRHEERARTIAATIGADLTREGEPYADNLQGPPAPAEENPACGDDVAELTADGWTHPAPEMVRLTSRFGEIRSGYTHQGDDLAAPADTPVYAAADGVATHVSCSPWKGRSECNILLDHGTDTAGSHIQTLYVHMFPDGVLVEQGHTVTAGEKIALVGNNGNSFGYHLHLEVWVDDVPVPAVEWFADQGIDLNGPFVNAGSA